MSLSTHVLDAVSGTPAVGVAVTLTDSASNVLTTAVTGAVLLRRRLATDATRDLPVSA